MVDQVNTLRGELNWYSRTIQLLEGRAANLMAQGPRVHIKKLPGEDWAPLFNGKDLNGWVEVGKEKWMVENGTIHGMAVSKDYGYLKTAKNYTDFHLTLKFNDALVTR